jgi:Protein of unknown function (DUF2855)
VVEPKIRALAPGPHPERISWRAVDFQVKRDDLRECRVIEADPPELEPGQALLAVDAFGLTTNNVTYAVFGEAMSYWDFFPAEAGWGRVPVWGFADVAATAHDGLAKGTRLFGYYPPSTHLVVTPAPVDERGFVDSSPHRANLPSAYNRYSTVDADPMYDPAYEDQQMLLGPLFFTSFLIDDFLDDNGFFDAGAAVLSSASSKTALSLAFLLDRREGIEVIGLTSPGRVGFVEGTGVYDRVVPYDAVDSLPEGRSVYVDMSGDAGVRKAVHDRYGEALAHSAVVGATHWDRMGGTEDLPGPDPTFFFAPDRLSKRSRDWGAGGLESRMGEAWRPFVEWSTGWLEVRRGGGPEAVEAAYLELLEGRIDPATAHVLSMQG